MPSVMLPDMPGPRSAVPRYMDFGGLQRPALGGKVQRIDRLGNRFALDVELPPLTGAQAQVWIARLIRGRSEQAIMEFPQPGVVPPGRNITPIRSGGGVTPSGASVIEIWANNEGLNFSEGQFITLFHDGRRYLHQVTADASAVSLGIGVAVAIQPRTRSAFVLDDKYDMFSPSIEGYVVGDETSWTIDVATTYGLSFSIEEPG